MVSPGPRAPRTSERSRDRRSRDSARRQPRAQIGRRMSERPSSQVYTWEPSNAQIAARYGLRPEDVLRFDTEHLAAAAAVPRRGVGRTVRADAQRVPGLVVRRADGGGSGLRRGRAGSDRWRGRGRDPGPRRQGLPGRGSSAIVPIPTYAMYGVLTSQRAARITAVPRLDAADGFALDVARIVDRLAEASVVWLCNPNNPTGAPEPTENIEALLTATAALANPPLVVVDEAYFEFVRRSVVPWRDEFHNLLVVRTVSKAFALAGVRVGLCCRCPVGHRAARARPSAGLDLDHLGASRNPRTVRARVCARKRPHAVGRARLARRAARRARLAHDTERRPTSCSRASATTRPPKRPLTPCSIRASCRARSVRQTHYAATSA